MLSRLSSEKCEIQDQTFFSFQVTNTNFKEICGIIVFASKIKSQFVNLTGKKFISNTWIRNEARTKFKTMSCAPCTLEIIVSNAFLFMFCPVNVDKINLRKQNKRTIIMKSQGNANSINCPKRFYRSITKKFFNLSFKNTYFLSF